MLMALQKNLSSRIPHIKFVVEANNDYQLRSSNSCYQIIRKVRGINLQPVSKLIPSKIRQRLGLINEDQIYAVIDASGFAYGDQWGVDKIVERLHPVLELKKSRNLPLIILPQAMGPFTAPGMVQAFQDVISNADLIYVRDQQSYQYLSDSFKSLRSVKLCPDSTINLTGLVDPVFEPFKGRPAIVPNHMMVKSANEEEKALYVKLLAESTESAQKLFGKAFIVLHDTEQDKHLADLLKSELGDIEVVSDPRPLVIKSLLANSSIVIGSRFHALVSSLSSSVPVVAFGWSHKYEELLESFGCSNHIIKVENKSLGLSSKVIKEIHSNYDAHVKILTQRKAKFSIELNGMWDEIANAIYSVK